MSHNGPGPSAYSHVPVGAPHPHEAAIAPHATSAPPAHEHLLLIELRVFNSLLSKLLTKKPAGDIDLDQLRADERAHLESEG